jgi:hypothetical protein
VAGTDRTVFFLDNSSNDDHFSDAPEALDTTLDTPETNTSEDFEDDFTPTEASDMKKSLDGDILLPGAFEGGDDDALQATTATTSKNTNDMQHPTDHICNKIPAISPRERKGSITPEIVVKWNEKTEKITPKVSAERQRIEKLVEEQEQERSRSTSPSSLRSLRKASIATILSDDTAALQPQSPGSPPRLPPSPLSPTSPTCRLEKMEEEANTMKQEKHEDGDIKEEKRNTELPIAPKAHDDNADASHDTEGPPSLPESASNDAPAPLKSEAVDTPSLPTEDKSPDHESAATETMPTTEHESDAPSPESKPEEPLSKVTTEDTEDSIPDSAIELSPDAPSLGSPHIEPVEAPIPAEPEVNDIPSTTETKDEDDFADAPQEDSFGEFPSTTNKTKEDDDFEGGDNDGFGDFDDFGDPAAAGGDFNDFDDFDGFEDGATGGEDFGDEFSVAEPTTPEPIIPEPVVASLPVALPDFSSPDVLASLVSSTEFLFPPISEKRKPTTIESRPFLTERSLSLWNQLVAPPSVQPPNWKISRIRRLFLVSLGIPLDLDEVLPPETKQKKLVLPSVHLPRHPDASSRPASRSSSTSRSGKKQAELEAKQKAEGFDMSGARMLAGTSIEALKGMTGRELLGHVERLERVIEEAEEVRKYWEQRKEGAKGDKETFEQVIESLVGYAKKQRGS